VTLVTIWLQALDCYMEWVYGLMDINAEFEECLAAWSQGPYTQDGLWECIQTYAGQWAALTSEYFGCFN